MVSHKFPNRKQLDDWKQTLGQRQIKWNHFETEPRSLNVALCQRIVVELDDELV